MSCRIRLHNIHALILQRAACRTNREKERVTISCPVGSISPEEEWAPLWVEVQGLEGVRPVYVQRGECDGGGDEGTGCTAPEECVQPGGTSGTLVPPSLPPSSAPLSLLPVFCPSTSSPPLCCRRPIAPSSLGQRSPRQERGRPAG